MAAETQVDKQPTCVFTEEKQKENARIAERQK